MRLFPYITTEAVSQPEIPWNLVQVNAPSFWARCKGEGAVIAIIDTGLDVNHPDFAGRIISPRNFTDQGGQEDVTDKEGHGTHVAGIIAGEKTGVAPAARIMPLKVFGQSSNGDPFENAFKFILEYNQKVPEQDRVVAINCSWGGQEDPVMVYQIRELLESGVLTVVAAGNAGDGDPTHVRFSWPGFIWECVTTGATNQDGSSARYSSAYDGIDIGAPGTDIYSTWPGGGYKILSGTSMATPHVTGAAALIYSAFRKREGRYPTSDEAEQVLFNHIRKVPLVDELVGKGVLDLTYDTKRWPLYRVQLGAYFAKEGAEKTVERVSAMGISTYVVKY